VSNYRGRCTLIFLTLFRLKLARAGAASKLEKAGFQLQPSPASRRQAFLPTSAKAGEPVCRLPRAEISGLGRPRRKLHETRVPATRGRNGDGAVLTNPDRYQPRRKDNHSHLLGPYKPLSFWDREDNGHSPGNPLILINPTTDKTERRAMTFRCANVGGRGTDNILLKKSAASPSRTHQFRVCHSAEGGEKIDETILGCGSTHR